ncbi:hypothetical protein QY96_00706 [Bacillus thermotolerans]|nr:hypothetical protein QY96_00706 [Bacillus thermotolerans]
MTEDFINRMTACCMRDHTAGGFLLFILRRIAPLPYVHE